MMILARPLARRLVVIGVSAAVALAIVAIGGEGGALLLGASVRTTRRRVVVAGAVVARPRPVHGRVIARKLEAAIPQHA